MTPIKWRLTGFASAMVLVALMIAWAAHASWQKVAKLSEKLTSAQIASFQTADYFRANLSQLNFTLLRYERDRNQAERGRFLTGWSNLNDWIDVQRPTLTSEKEQQILDQINTNYDDYFAAATNLLQNIETNPVTTSTTIAGFNKVEDQSQRLLDFAYQLVSAHRESLGHFLADSQKSLGFLRMLIFSSLFLLLILGAWLAGVVYREMINPLRLKLVESHAIIERQEKLASLGVLAAGVAHEIRNPLTAIKARLFTQQKALRPASPEFQDAQVIGGEIDRLERIVRSVLEFARPAEPRLERLSAAKVLAEIGDLFGQQMRRAGIELRVEPAPDAALRADPEQLKQVIINLVRNAAESIGGRGQIILRGRTAAGRLHGLFLPLIILEVEDTGTGMTPEVQKRLFDPFFSTKEGGTGLGLAIAARILEKHGGALEFKTQVNRGTTFGIVLPQAEAA
jgi:signal transduction histidine kinase